MKQRVNLYQVVLQPPKQQLGLQQLLVCWIAVVFAIALLWIWQQQQIQQKQQDLNAAQQQLNLLQQELALYQDALVKRQPSEDLARQLSTEQRSLQRKQQLLSFLSVKKHAASQHYSPVLSHLNHVDRKELWLTAFSLQQQQSSFTGITLRPDSVPLWLNDLRQLGYFHGQRFGRVSMQQIPDRKAVSFSLQAEQGNAI